MSNTVTITLAGDPGPAVSAFDKVGKASGDMSHKVKQSGEAFDRAAERTDVLDTRAMGFRDTLTGVQDSVTGVKAIASGDWGFTSLLTLGMGVGDLASGFTNFLIPAVSGMKTAMMGLNLTFLASPITWIIIGIVALVAVFVILWVKCAWFREFWIGLWDKIKTAAHAVVSWFTDTAWPWIKGVFERTQDIFKQVIRNWQAGWAAIKGAASTAWDWIASIPGKIGSAFLKVVDFIGAPFRKAFNLVSDAWNNTIGRLSWTVPGWVPGLGGKTISVPKLPHFHSGGTVPGGPWTETLAVLRGGETVSPPGAGGTATVVLRIEGDGALAELIRRIVKVEGGGDVNVAFGR